MTSSCPCTKLARRRRNPGIQAEKSSKEMKNLRIAKRQNPEEWEQPVNVRDDCSNLNSTGQRMELQDVFTCFGASVNFKAESSNGSPPRAQSGQTHDGKSQDGVSKSGGKVKSPHSGASAQTSREKEAILSLWEFQCNERDRDDSTKMLCDWVKLLLESKHLN